MKWFREKFADEIEAEDGGRGTHNQLKSQISFMAMLIQIHFKIAEFYFISTMTEWSSSWQNHFSFIVQISYKAIECVKNNFLSSWISVFISFYKISIFFLRFIPSTIFIWF